MGHHIGTFKKMFLGSSWIKALLLWSVSSDYAYGWSSISRSSVNRIARGGWSVLHESGSGSSGDLNVVLRPSGKEDAFDGIKIGSSRVHRYGRSGEDNISPDDEQAEYVMWYHGRTADIDEKSDKLPPLSTGRIGRATSRNGLVWERCEDGSLSEDMTGVALGLNAEEWWGFDTAHVGLGQVLLPMSTPAVMAEGGVYLMYYMGGSYEETPLSNYMPGLDDETVKIQGMNMKIGVAVSQDGKTWGRVEGDDPSGAVMAPFSKDDPNMKVLSDMVDDDNQPLNLEEELYCAWPEVVYNEWSSKKGNRKTKHNFFMFYSSMTKDTLTKQINCAVSEDGFRWYKRGSCLKPTSGDETSLEDAGVARCAVVQHAIFDEDKNTWNEQPLWIMLYEGISSKDNKHRIFMATSNDARTWEKRGLVLDVSSNDDAWDCMGVGSPHIIRLDDGTTRLYYTGQGPNGQTAIGVAKTPLSDILNKDEEEQLLFQREQATIIFSS